MSESDIRDELELLAARCPPPEPDAAEIWERVQRARGRAGRRPRLGGSGRSVLRWATAAGVAALIAGGMLVPPIRAAMDRTIAEPVRSWGVERLTGLQTWLGALDAHAPAGADSVSVGTTNAVERLEIVPSPVLEVVIGACQARGSLTVRRHAAAVAVLESAGDPGGARMIATAGGARVDNTAASTASYRLLVPAGVRQVWVHIGSLSTLLPIRAADPAGWTLFLQSADGTSDEIGHCRP